jgi:type II secretory pathway pseudopilin PulG
MLEVLVSVAIIATLLAILLPMLGHARTVSRTTVCASNLRQLGMAWQAYLHDYERFPRHTDKPDWRYGGVQFAGSDRQPRLDPERPLNKALTEAGLGEAADLTGIYKCPGDRGVFERGGRRAGPQSVLAGGSCYLTFGNSYRANPALLDSSAAGISGPTRALKLADITAGSSQLLLTGDSAWWYATRPPGDPDSAFEAAWHGQTDAGNMLTLDGSVRFVPFSSPGGTTRGFKLSPRP